MANMVGSTSIFLWMSELCDEGRAVYTTPSCPVNINKPVPNAQKPARLIRNSDVLLTLTYMLTKGHSKDSDSSLAVFQACQFQAS
jgi:hypothetical protein